MELAFCKLTFCFSFTYNVYNSFPSIRRKSHFESFMWYVLLLIQKYPCGIKWGSRKKWDAFSRIWNLPSQPLHKIYSTCDDIQDPSCPTAPPPTTTPTSATPHITSESSSPTTSTTDISVQSSSSPSMTNRTSSTPYITSTEPSPKEKIAEFSVESSGSGSHGTNFAVTPASLDPKEIQ